MDELINRLVYHLMEPPLGQAIADDVYIPMMDELLVTPPSDSQAVVAITPTIGILIGISQEVTNIGSRAIVNRPLKVRQQQQQ